MHLIHWHDLLNAQDPANPRFSTSEALLEVALAHAREKLNCPTKLIKLT